jgi:hypothetical protein
MSDAHELSSEALRPSVSTRRPKKNFSLSFGGPEPRSKSVTGTALGFLGSSHFAAARSGACQFRPRPPQTSRSGQKFLRRATVPGLPVACRGVPSLTEGSLPPLWPPEVDDSWQPFCSTMFRFRGFSVDPNGGSTGDGVGIAPSKSRSDPRSEARKIPPSPVIGATGETRATGGTLCFGFGKNLAICCDEGLGTGMSPL